MKTLFITFVAYLVMVTSAALAGPIGDYDVAGTNPGGSPSYDGTVSVDRHGATYVVVWNVGGEEYIGTGVGAANVKGSVVFGDAEENDTAIAVSYISGESFGLALFAEQPNGQWHGIWAYGGSDTIGSETWTPRN